MCRHNHPGMDIIPFAIKKEECCFGKFSNTWVAKPGISVPPVKVFLDSATAFSLCFEYWQVL